MADAVRWQQGRDRIDALIAEGRLERVHPDKELAELLLTQATTHLNSGRTLMHADSVGAFQLVYDGARKALTAILANQGLRPKGGTGGHAVLLTATRAQLHPPLGADLDQFDWMRRLRNSSEYPAPDTPVATFEDVSEALTTAARLIEISTAVIPRMPVY